jgi:hypothetical protein
VESIWTICGVLLGFWQDWIRSPGIVSILMDSIRSPAGVYLESSRILWYCTLAATLREVQMDS